jgi:hypothetical protein
MIAAGTRHIDLAQVSRRPKPPSQVQQDAPPFVCLKRALDKKARDCKTAFTTE